MGGINLQNEEHLRNIAKWQRSTSLHNAEALVSVIIYSSKYHEKDCSYFEILVERGRVDESNSSSDGRNIIVER